MGIKFLYFSNRGLKLRPQHHLKPVHQQHSLWGKSIWLCLLLMVGMGFGKAYGQAAVPFGCADLGYQTVNSTDSPFPATVFSYNTANNTRTTLATLPFPVNCLGYNVKDNYLYAFRTSLPVGTTEGVMVKIDANGRYTEITIPALPVGTLNAGDISPDGYFYAFSNSGTKYYCVDVDPNRTATYGKLVDPSTGALSNSGYTSTMTIANDLAYNPKDGLLYGVGGGSGSNLRLGTINPKTGAAGYLTPSVSGDGIESSTVNGAFGAAFFDANNNLYVFSNSSGQYYRVNISTHIATAAGAAFPPSDSNDGAICANAVFLSFIDGNVYNDNNGLTDNTVNGSGTNLSAALNAVLWNVTDNRVEAVTTVNADGTYGLGARPNKTYLVILTTASPAVGATTMPTASLPTGWRNTGENVGAGAGSDGAVNGKTGNIAVGRTDIANVNFGINQPRPGVTLIKNAIPDAITPFAFTTTAGNATLVDNTKTTAANIAANDLTFTDDGKLIVTSGTGGAGTVYTLANATATYAQPLTGAGVLTEVDGGSNNNTFIGLMGGAVKGTTNGGTAYTNFAGTGGTDIASIDATRFFRASGTAATLSYYNGTTYIQKNGNFNRIDYAYGTFAGIGTNSAVYVSNNITLDNTVGTGSLTIISGTNFASDIAIGNTGLNSIYITDATGNVKQYSGSGTTWTTLTAPPSNALKITVDPLGKPWISMANGNIAAWTGTSWKVLYVRTPAEATNFVNYFNQATGSFNITEAATTGYTVQGISHEGSGTSAANTANGTDNLTLAVGDRAFETFNNALVPCAAGTVYSINSSDRRTLAVVNTSTGIATNIVDLFAFTTAPGNTLPIPAELETTAIAYDILTNTIWYSSVGDTDSRIYGYNLTTGAFSGGTAFPTQYAGTINKAAYNPVDRKIYFHLADQINGNRNLLFSYDPANPTNAPVLIGRLTADGINGLGTDDTAAGWDAFRGGDIVFDGLGNMSGTFYNLNKIMIFPANYNASGNYLGINLNGQIIAGVTLQIPPAVAFLPDGNYLVGDQTGLININTNTGAARNISNYQSSDMASCAAPSPVLSHTKKAVVNCAAAGSTITYTIIVTNSGQFHAVNTRLIDALPNGVTLTLATLNGTAISGITNSTLASGILIKSTNAITDGQVLKGESATIILNCSLNNAGGTVSNQSFVTYNGIESLNLPNDRLPSDDPNTLAVGDATVVNACATLSGTVRNDNDGQTGGVTGTGLGNVTVSLYQANGSTLISTTTTDANGVYDFVINVATANYVIKVTPLSGYQQVSASDGVTPTDGSTNVTFTGTPVANIDFGINQPPTLQADLLSCQNSGAAATIANLISNDTDPNNGTLSASNIKLIVPSGATGTATGFTVPNQGTWALNTTTGALTFTPQNGYTGNPTAVQYTVTDAAGLVSSAATATITYKPATSFTATPVSCFGGNNGAIDLSVSGGAGSYKYAWAASDGGTVPAGQASQQDLTNLTAGTYTATITDANGSGCSATQIVTITQGALPEKPTVSLTQPTCATPTATIRITAPAMGANIRYSIDGVNYQASNTFTGVAPGATYSVMVRNTTTGCISDVTSAVIDPVGKSSTVNTQPADQQVIDKDNASFTTAVSGGSGITRHQWQVSTNKGVTWTNLSDNAIYSATSTDPAVNALSSTLNISGATLAMNGYLYRDVVSQTDATCVVQSAGAKLTVTAQSNLAITKTINNTTPKVGSNVTFTLNASNAGPSDATNVKVNDLLPGGYTFVSANAPTGTIYDAATGLWTIGNLAKGANVSITIIAKVNDTGNYTNTATVSATETDPDLSDNSSSVTPTPNHVPTAVNDTNTTAEDTPVSGNVSTNDSCPDGGCTYTVPQAGTPQSGTVTMNPDGTYTYTPNANFNGTDSFSYQVCDQEGDCATATVTITVTPVNHVPTAVNDTNTTAEDTPVSGNVSTNDSCPDGGCTYALQPADAPQNGTVTMNPDGTYTYTPNANFNGTDTFSYQVCDKDGDCATATVTITVTPQNDVPTANNDTNTTVEDSPVSGDVSTNDSCPDGGCSFAVSPTGAPQNGTVTMNPDGTYTYTPNANFNGTDSFSYQVCDKDNDCVTATVTITVTPVNDVPTAVDDTNTTAEDTPVNGNVSTNDSCPDGGCTYTVPQASGPKNGTVMMNPDGTYTYTPNANFNGTDTFSYQVCDKDNDCVTATVTITVTPVNDVPTAVNDTNTTAEDTPVNGNVSTNDSCPDGGCTYTVPQTSGPQNGTVTMNPDGTYTYTPNANFNGTDSFTYQVCDKDNDCVTATVTITVTPVNDVPTAVNDTNTTAEDTPVNGNVSTNDSCPDGGCTYTVPQTSAPQNGTVTMNPDGTYTYTPNANFNGTDSFSYQVCDKDNDCVTATVTITVTPVNDQPMANDDTNTTAEDTPVNGNVSTNDSCPDGGCTYTVPQASAPQNGTVTMNPDGTYTYTPNANFNGTDSFSYQVCDKDNDCVTATVTITVTPVNDQPTANNDTNTTAEDSPVSGNVSTNDSCPDGGCTYTVPQAGAPQNGTVTMNPDGTYTYTPNANFNGTDSFSYQVCDQDGDCVTATVTITVTPVNDVPTAVNDTNTTAEDTPVNGNVSINDSCPDGGCSFAITQAGAPQNGTVTMNPDGTYTYTPNANFNGTDSFSYQVCDQDGDCVTATVTITVTPVNNQPTANDDTNTTAEDSPVSGNVSTNDSCPDGGCSFAITQAGAPQNGTVTMNPDGTYTYTPNANFNGTDSFSYQVCDQDGDCVTATVTITVTPVNDQPTANDDTNTTAEDSPVSGNVSTNDSCPDGGCSFAITQAGAPQNGTVTMNPDGTYTYTPNANFNGTDSFSYQVCDKEGDCVTATVTITVTPVNDQPTANNDTNTTAEDSPVSGNVSTNDSCPDGGCSFAITQAGAPQNGTVTMNPDGTYTYTPNANFNGTDSFTYQVCDKDNDCVTATVTITVTPVNDQPTANDDTNTTAEDTPVSGNVSTNDSCPDGGCSFAITQAGAPQNGTVTMNPDGTYTYTPNANFNGTDSFSYQVCDKDGDCAIATVTITVTPVNDVPTAVNDTNTTAEDTPVNGNVSVNDSCPDGGCSFAISPTGAPQNGTVTMNPDGTYTYTPNANFNGTDSFSYQVCDKDGDCATATVTITVTPVNDQPTANNDTNTTAEDTPVSGNVSTNDSCPDGGCTYTIPSAGAPQNGTVTMNPDGTYTYTPNANFNGTDSFSYQVCDKDGDCVTVTVTITVTPVNDVPTAVNDTNTTAEDTPVSGNVSTNDSCPDGGCTYTVPQTNGPQKGTVTMNPDGTYTYTPNANFNGTDSFSYQVCDKDNDCVTATVTITVTPVNDPPVASSVPVTTPQDTPVSGKITASDPDGDPLSFTVSTPPAHGTVTVNPDGSYTYTPAPGYSGTDSFVTTVCDDKGACATVTTPITVTVKPNNPPVASSVPVTTPQDTPVSGKITASDPDGDPLTFTVSTPPAHGTVTVNPDGSYTYTPAAGYSGTDSFVTTVCDDKGACATVTTPITVTVKPNNPPVASSVPVTTPQDTPVSGKITASDRDGDPLTFTVSTPPAHGTVTVNPDGSYTYTPAPGYSGTDSFVTTVCDDKGACTTVTTPITVTPVTVPVANVSVVKTVDIINPAIGSQVVFTIRAANAGPADAGNVIARDVLPSGYTFVSASAPNGTNYNNTSGVWTIGTLTNGASMELSITVRVNVSGNYANTATITSSSPDGNPADNSSTVTPAPRALANLSVVKTVDNLKPVIGRNVVFNIRAFNAGPGDASNVVARDMLPSGYTFVSAKAPNGTNYNSSTGAWTIGTLVNNTKMDLAITARVNARGNYTNRATIISSTPDGNMADNSSTVTPVPVAAKPVAVNDASKTGYNTPVVIDILANDKPDGSPLLKGSIEIVDQPLNGTVRLNMDGTVTYTPKPGYTGIDTFTYRVKDADGNWTNVATVTVKIDGFFIPNVFTPNGDGKNDTFFIVGLESFDSADIEIYNRWGNQVYRMKGYQNDWSGTGLNEGTYYYKITLKKGADVQRVAGPVLLKRN